MRQRSIKDRSFNACVDVLKAGRLVAAEANSLWYDVYIGASRDRIVEYETPFDNALRNRYSASEAARLTLPPAAIDAFQAYIDTLAPFLSGVHRWKNDYLGTTSSPGEKLEARADKCVRLRDEALCKRDEFVEVVKAQFDEGVWS